MNYKIQLYPHAVKFSTKKELLCEKQSNNSKRDQVTIFSDKSKKRLSFIYNNYTWKSMITLTYHVNFPLTGKESKNHLHNVLRILLYLKIEYLWVLEWQGRGFPHYHIWLSRELTEQERIKIAKSWLKVTQMYNDTVSAKNHHLSDHIYTKWNVNIGLNYACKYATKMKQKWLPLGYESYGRWWGKSRFKIESETESEFNELYIENIKEIKQFNRNVHRCVKHWGKKKKKSSFYGALQGYCFTFSDSRMKAINRLFEYHNGNLTKEKDAFFVNVDNDFFNKMCNDYLTKR